MPLLFVATHLLERLNGWNGTANRPLKPAQLMPVATATSLGEESMGYFVTERAVRVVPGASKYEHRFGGPPLHRAVGPTKFPFTLHCLYLLHTGDPALPRILRKRRWLPLYYPLFNNACEFAYEVVDDNEIKVHLVSDRVQEDFPFEHFPEELPERRVRLEPLSYDDQKTLVYAFTARDCLSKEAISSADRKFVASSGYPFTQVGGIQYMMQGIPRQRCPNSSCEYAGHSPAREVFAVVWNRPVPDFLLWGEYMDWSQLIFQVCSKCSTIYVCNRCD